MKTIVWDVDDVLNDLMREWFEDWLCSGRSGVSLAYGGLKSNPPHELLGISRSEYLESLDAFRLSGKFERMRPVPEVFEWFYRYGKKFHNVAITSTPLVAGPASARWVMRNFGRWIRTFHIIPSSRPGDDAPRYHATKSDFLSWWGNGYVLVDDSEENAAGAISSGMAAVLVPRPWNSSGLTLQEALAKLTTLALH